MVSSCFYLYFYRLHFFIIRILFKNHKHQNSQKKYHNVQTQTVCDRQNLAEIKNRLRIFKNQIGQNLEESQC